MIVNGVDLSEYMRIKRINRQLAPSVENIVFDVPGMHGAHHIRNIRKARKIEVEFTVIGNSVSDRIEKAHIIAGYVTSEQDMTIILPDEPEKVYIGSLSGETNLDEILHTAQGTLTFFCSDPHILDDTEQTAQFNANGQLTVLNDGTAETYPSFSIAFNQPTTFFEIVNLTTEKRVRLGFPIEVEQTPIDPQELILHDTMASTSGWQSGVQVDGGTISGQFESDGEKFYVSDFGTGSSWHGPALKKSLSEEVQDFRIDTKITLNNSVGEVGRVEVYLLDANDNIIGKIALKDSRSNSQLNSVEARAGALNDGFYFISEAGDNPGVWNDFDGMLRIERQGNRWGAYIAKISPGGVHYARRTRFYTDFAQQFMNKLASVQVHIATSSDYQPCDMSINEMRVYKLNQPQDQQQEIPYIVHANDVVDIDNGLNRVLRNGEPLPQIVDVSTDFFPLEKGSNVLEVFPKDIATVTAKWRRRWV